MVVVLFFLFSRQMMHRLPFVGQWIGLVGVMVSGMGVVADRAIAQESLVSESIAVAEETTIILNASEAESAPTCADVPVFDRHVGIWEGTYQYFDANGELTDVHHSRLELRRDCNQWEQTNTYMWDDGKTVTFSFPGIFSSDNVLTIDTPRLYGEAWESENTILLTWRYLDQPGSQNFEMINLLSDDTRVRTWQLTTNGEVTGFVFISETRQ